jgi:14-3-3 protein epsilon
MNNASKPKPNNSRNSNNNNKMNAVDSEWEQWGKLRLVCKSWERLASHPSVFLKFERFKLASMAKLAQQACRYEEMVEFINEVARLGVDMTEEERNVFQSAYKLLTSKKRNSWKMLSSIECQLNNKNLKKMKDKEKIAESKSDEEENEKKRDNWKVVSKCCRGVVREENIMQVNKYRLRIEEEVRQICNEVFNILDTYVIPNNTSTEGKVFFLKMRADYLRYQAEISQGEERTAIVSTALHTYTQATRLATLSLHPTHPVRLALGLSFAVFFYQILHETERATRLAKQTFDAAVEEMAL